MQRTRRIQTTHRMMTKKKNKKKNNKSSLPKQQGLPEWLCAVSDFARNFGENDCVEHHASTTSEEVLSAMPVCDIDCTDGDLYHKVLGAWCVPWPEVPLKPFLAAWFALDKAARQALLDERMVFAEELDVEQWGARMLQRDDAAMLAALPPAALVAASSSWEEQGVHAPTIYKTGATKCLCAWAQLNGWGDNWAEHVNRCLLANNWGGMYQAPPMVAAATNGQVHMLALLLQHGCEWGNFVCMAAAEFGQVGSLAYLHEQGCPWDARVCAYAAGEGHLECVQYYYASMVGDADEPAGSSGSLMNPCKCAAEGGHLECLRFLHERGCSWDEHAASSAAKNGHLGCLRYLHEQGCPWSAQACAQAAQHGRLECLTYLHEQGCPWNGGVCTNAASHGHLDCLRYAHEQGCPWSAPACGKHPFHHMRDESVVKRGDARWDCIQYAREHGCPRTGGAKQLCTCHNYHFGLSLSTMRIMAGLAGVAYA